MGKRAIHPKKTKRYKSKESYRKFRAYTHMRTPSGRRATMRRQSISGVTPRSHKERHIRVAGRPHTVRLS